MRCHGHDAVMTSTALLPILQRNLARVQQRIEHACALANREHPPQLIAVTKYAPEPAFSAFLETGHLQLGESRVQQLNERAEQYNSHPISWHLIGHLQRNKVRLAIEHASLIHSVDSLRLLQAIEKAAVEQNKQIKVLLQWNISGEQSKSGLAPSEWDQVLKAVAELKRVTVEGLMTMAPYTDQQEVIRSTFTGLAELKEQLQHAVDSRHPMTELSMGMSHDLEIAIECGATMVRIGTDLFREIPGYGKK